MSKLDELIRELCPDGVEFRKVGDIANISRGKVMSKDFLKENAGEYPVYSSQTENEGKLGSITTYMFDGEYLTWTTDGANAGTVFYRSGKFSVTNVCGVIDNISEDVNTKYLYYVLNRVAPTYVNCGMGNPKLMSNVMARISLPIPPLEIQREIVRILDNFTNLTAELAAKLTAEFTARQRQYEFYRDKLLTFDVLKEGTINFCQRTLGEMFDFRNGLSKGKEFFGKGTPFIRYTDVYNHRTLRKKDITALVECTEDEKERLKVSRGDVLFTRTSETAEDIGWSSVMLDDMDDCVFNGFTIKATPKTKELLPEYCAYCFSTSDFRQYVTKHCAFTTRASLTGNTIAQYRMTIPPLDIQSRIVNVLDNFEKICSDLNIGLPAEMEARQKQYEYYRDKLLTFKEVAAT